MPAELRAGPLAGSRWTDFLRACQVGWILVQRVIFGGRHSRKSWGERLRLAFEDLGLTYLKLGQYMAMRFDVFPAQVCSELQKLFESVAPLDFGTIRRVIEAELGSLDACFAAFAEDPIASASVAQVHEAVTSAGERVAVKVQRPGIEVIFGADMRNLWRLAALADRLLITGSLSLRGFAAQFISWTAGELDFVTEGRTAERLRRSAGPYEVVPAVIWPLTRRRVLTMEFVDGVSLNVVTELLEAGRAAELERRLPGIDLTTVLQRLASACFRQLFGEGFFHGDPHPGNIIICRDGSVAFVDMGIFGELTSWHRRRLSDMVENMALGNAHEAFWSYADLCEPTPKTDMQAFERDGTEAFEQWYKSSIDPSATAADRHLGKHSGRVLDLVRYHHLHMAYDTVLFWRALLALDSTALLLPDYFDIVESLSDYFTKNRGSALRQLGHIVQDPAWLEMLSMLRREAPTHMRDAVETMNGRLSWRAVKRDSDHQRRTETQTAKAVGVSVVAVSLVLLTGGSAAGVGVVAAVATMLAVAAMIAVVRMTR